MKKLKIFFIFLFILLLSCLIGFLVYKNIKLNDALEQSTQQVTSLESQLKAIGEFTDVLTVYDSVKMGDEVTKSNITTMTVPIANVPTNALTSLDQVKNSYYRIDIGNGTVLTRDLIMKESYQGSVYDRDIFLDSLPVGTQVGDYIDIRMVLPGGEEFVVFPHKRVNARYENAIKLNLSEYELWIYTSLMVDRALYRDVGFKVYCTKYVDPGSHDRTKAYYPVRKEVVDIVNISPNLTDTQRKNMFNESLRNSIDTKLKYYADPLNTDSSKLQSAVSEEEQRYSQAQQYYLQLYEELQQNGSTGTNTDDENAFVDPTEKTEDEEPIGDLNDAPTIDGDGNTVPQDEIDSASGDNLFDDESIIE